MNDVKGSYDPRFQRVYDALASSLEAGTEVGASLYLNIEGEAVIDLWGGWRDREHSAPWVENTIVNVFSATKTVTSLAVLILADRGLIDLHAPVTEYWPEFGRNGKQTARVRHLLSHTVGLPAWDPPFSLADALDVETSTARLAAQAPWWPPGDRGSYHASTFGHLNSELVRRVTGKSLSSFIADEMAGPLDADFYLGLSEDLFDRVATVYPVESEAAEPRAGGNARADDGLAVERDISQRTRLGSFSGQKRDAFALFNSSVWRRSELGGSSGHANARGLGRMMTALSNGGVSRGLKLLSTTVADNIFQTQFQGIDAYYMKPIRWGVGYALAPLKEKERGPLPFIRPGNRTCYWYGSGGAFAIVDAERHMALSYTMNQCQPGRNSLNGLYYNAIYDSL